MYASVVPHSIPEALSVVPIEPPLIILTLASVILSEAANSFFSISTIIPCISELAGIEKPKFVALRYWLPAAGEIEILALELSLDKEKSAFVQATEPKLLSLTEAPGLFGPEESANARFKNNKLNIKIRTRFFFIC